MQEREGSSAQRAPVRVLPVPLDQPVIVRHLGPLRGALLHWHSGRSKPCEGVDSCPTALHRTRTIWRAYGAVEGWNGVSRQWVPAVLELTASGEECVRGRDLRGEVWLWDREGERGKRAPVFGVYCERVEESSLRPAFDLMPILCRFFNVRTIRLDIPNPTPPKLYLEPVAGAPPNLPELPGNEPERILSPDEIRESIRKARERLGPQHPIGNPSRNGKDHA